MDEGVQLLLIDSMSKERNYKALWGKAGAVTDDSPTLLSITKAFPAIPRPVGPSCKPSNM